MLEAGFAQTDFDVPVVAALDYLQAERGELIDGAQACREIQAMTDDGRLSKR